MSATTWPAPTDDDVVAHCDRCMVTEEGAGADWCPECGNCRTHCNHWTPCLVGRYDRLLDVWMPDRAVPYPADDADRYAQEHNQFRGGVWFALVETSSYGQTYVTLHQSADDAVRAHYSQESAEDWTLRSIIDVWTGDEYEPVVTYGARRIGGES